MVPQGLLANAQVLSYFLVRGACLVRERGHDCPLFSRQRTDFFCGGIRRRLSRTNKVDKDSSGGASPEPQFTSVNFLDCSEDVDALALLYKPPRARP